MQAMKQKKKDKFQHTAARRRLRTLRRRPVRRMLFQHTAARRRLPLARDHAACFAKCFNTQPPEGGCEQKYAQDAARELFQHTAARRRLRPARRAGSVRPQVSTHSRPKAAAPYLKTL